MRRLAAGGVAGEDAKAMEEAIRAGSPEDLARMLAESVAALTAGPPPA